MEFDQSPEVMAWKTNCRTGSRSHSVSTWRGGIAAGMASATMLCACSSVCSSASGALLTGNLLNALVAFSLSGMCLMVALNVDQEQ